MTDNVIFGLGHILLRAEFYELHFTKKNLL